jgi:hypothetical protein
MCGRIRTKGTSRTLVGLAVVAVAALGITGSASATSLSYTFDFGNQGWLQKQDQASTSIAPAGFAASGGSPGGHLTATDSGAEGGCSKGANPCQLLTFFSPFVPTLAANYGGTGSFDLRSEDVNPAFGAELLLLPPGSLYLDGLITEASGTDYHHLSIPLNETGNWAVCTYVGGPGSCHPSNQAEFMSLIAASDLVAVMADVGPDGTGETYDLDNFTLTDGPPQPPASPPAMHKKCKKKKHRGKHRAAAAKKCKKKKRQHRRAAIARFRG